MDLTEKEFLDWKLGLLASDLEAIAHIMKNEKDLKDVEKEGLEAEANLIKRWVTELEAEREKLG